jgi:hypothetical protein
MKKRNLIIRIAGYIAAVALLSIAGCVLFTEEPADMKGNSRVETPAAESALTYRDYLALTKTQESHKVSIDKLQEMAAGVLQNTSQGRSVASNGSIITGVKKLPISNTRNFAGSPGLSRSAAAEHETEPVEIYELSVGQPGGESEGFVLASNDIRIGSILAIAEGSLEDVNDEFLEVLNGGLQDYIDFAVDEYNSITESEIEAAIEKALAENTDAERTAVTHWDDYKYLSGGDWVPTSFRTDFSAQKNPLLLTNGGRERRALIVPPVTPIITTSKTRETMMIS